MFTLNRGKVSRTPTAIKLLIDLHDGRSVETVLLKSKAASSVCVSSQVRLPGLRERVCVSQFRSASILRGPLD
jgi:adenine C2-methylase RlmN of 23S rRNA A2503 and tRNA A37